MVIHSGRQRLLPHMTRATIAATLCCYVASACASATSGDAPNDAETSAGSIMGSLDGRAFDRVAAAWLIGAPDDPKQTRVVYVFDREIVCDEITKPGWDETVANSTQSLEMKLIGTKPGTYGVAKNGR